MKYKIGDKVIIVQGGYLDKKIHTIEEVNPNQAAPYRLDGYRMWWKDCELQLIEPAEPAHKVDCTITENYLKEKARMTGIKIGGYACSIRCNECPFHSGNNGKNVTCGTLQASFPAEAIAIVQKWSDEHPEEPPKPVKTIKDDLLEKYPKAMLDKDGVPTGCIKWLGYQTVCPPSGYCTECWNRPLEEVQK